VFPVCFVLMTRKTKVLYKAVFEHIKTLVPNFEPESVMADYEDASVQALSEVYDNGLVVKGCWFHFAKAVIKRVKTVGLAIAFRNDVTVRKCIKGLTCLPLLPHDKIVETLDLILQYATAVPAQYKDNIVTVFMYIRRRWIECSSVGTERLSVFGCTERTNNNAESFHSRFKCRVQRAHPNIFHFLRHLRDIATDLMSDVARLEQRKRIKRRTPKKHRKYATQLQHCIDKFRQGRYSNSLDFLFAVSHYTDNVTQPLDSDDGDETEEYDIGDLLDEPTSSTSTAAQPASITDNICDVCWSAERAKVVFVPCGHSRFCQNCADRCFASDSRKCAVCRARIDFVMPIFN